MSKLLSGLWQNLSADFRGPLPTGEYLLGITDEYSHYPVVELTHSTSAEKVIPIVEKVFAMFECPVVGNTLIDYSTFVGVQHRKITPLWPQANALRDCKRRLIEKLFGVLYLFIPCLKLGHLFSVCKLERKCTIYEND